MSRTPLLQRLIFKALDDAGLNYHVEIGKKHRKLYVEGKMVFVYSHGANVSKDIHQIKSLIRRMHDVDHQRPIRGA